MGSDKDNHAYQAGVGGDLFRFPLEELLSMEGVGGDHFRCPLEALLSMEGIGGDH